MKTTNITISLLRIASLLTLATFGFILLIGEEQDQNPTLFLLHMLLDKALAAAAIYAAYRLYKRWRTNDKYINSIDRWCQSGFETDNEF